MKIEHECKHLKLIVKYPVSSLKAKSLFFKLKG